MNNVNIILTRVDNRLLHGQVVTGWLKTYGINLVIIVNDSISEDKNRQSLLSMAAPSDIGVRFFSVNKTIEIIHKASASQVIAIICETPIEVYKLIKENVPIKEVNLGNMHVAEGKKKILNTIYANDEEISAIKAIIAMGVKVEARLLPNDLSKNLKDYI